MTDGLVFVVCGNKAEQEYTQALQALELSGNHYPIQRVGRDYGAVNKYASRSAKTTLPDWTDFSRFVYLDADTRVHADLSPLFAILDDGWDVVMTPSSNQDGEAFWHVTEKERQATFEQVGTIPLQLQCGVMAVARNERTGRLFADWFREWQTYAGEDQAAFIRALYRAPVRVWLMGYPWNGGAAINHRWGAIRES